MRLQWVMVVALGTCAATALADEPKKDNALQGTWVGVSGQSDGQDMAENDVKGMQFTVSGDKYSVSGPNDYSEKGTIKLDLSKTPKGIDLHIDESNVADQVNKDQPGIYELKDGSLKVCFARAGSTERPTEFTTKADTGQIMITFKRGEGAGSEKKQEKEKKDDK
jgi:uncharacterized protein (TIGR03067 family)